MEKRYQVFISSTFADLEEERKRIMEAVIELDCFPAGMEMFPASNSEQFDYIKGIIDQSDYYIIIIGGRYGSTDDNGISYTEKEFDYSFDMGIPIFAFIRDNLEKIEVNKTDNNSKKKKKLDDFRKKVETGRLVSYWSDPYELKAKLFSALTKGFKMFPRDGWVKGNIMTDAELLRQINNLRDENEKMREAFREKEEQESDEIEDQVIEQEVIDSVFKKCSNSKISITYIDSYDEKHLGITTLIDILRVIGGRLIYYSSTQSLQKYIGDNIIEIIDDIDEPNEEYSILGYCFDEIKIKLYALKIISMDLSDGNEYLRLTPLGNQTYFRTIKY